LTEDLGFDAEMVMYYAAQEKGEPFSDNFYEWEEKVWNRLPRGKVLSDEEVKEFKAAMKRGETRDYFAWLAKKRGLSP
jgi:hypothetical protein